MAEFTPWWSLLGGLLIGAGASLLLLANGRIAGISGIVGGLLRAERGETGWRALFVAGLLVGGLLLRLLAAPSIGPAVVGFPLLIAAELLVGFGTQLGSGCTSGHGVCGMSRLSTRSFVATAVFMVFAALTVFVTHHLIGAP